MSYNILKWSISHVTYAWTWLHNFSCILLLSNSTVSRGIWKNIHSWVFQRLQIALVLRTGAILIVFEKLTRACFSQIALETILLPIQTDFNSIAHILKPCYAGSYPNTNMLDYCASVYIKFQAQNPDRFYSACVVPFYAAYLNYNQISYCLGCNILLIR